MPVVLPKRPQSIFARTPIASAVLLAPHEPIRDGAAGIDLARRSHRHGAEARPKTSRTFRSAWRASTTSRIEDLNIQNFKTYTQYLPTVQTQQSMQTRRRLQPRLHARRRDRRRRPGDHVQPSVGTYLDEQPITTIRGNLDVHLYDIARVEALAGPQGTLYGASSQAGTIRIITNMPDASGFASGYSLEGNYRRRRRIRLCRRGLRQHPDGRQRGHSARGLGKARTGLDRQRGSDPHLPRQPSRSG